jgi:hypothetical protein
MLPVHVHAVEPGWQLAMAVLRSGLESETVLELDSCDSGNMSEVGMKEWMQSRQRPDVHSLEMGMRMPGPHLYLR